MAKVIMIQGTMSDSGKSFITAGLCRAFTQDGYKVAPFKSQNMALNSYITSEGKEMGRAQVVQAEACNKTPDVRMNPILLKPTSEMGSQVIVMGEAIGNMKAMDYYEKKKDFIPVIMEAFENLSKENDIIVIEGAGSPAEINLKENDIVNMGMAKLADAKVLLVGDIDRGGVFAQLLGTLFLLDDDERDRIIGLIINKFRGDKKILESGLSMLEEKCNKKVVGVVPMISISIEDEDSMSSVLSNKNISDDEGIIDICIIRLKWISNFTDFNALSLEENVNVRYAENPCELGNPDIIIIPGSKNTIDDMKNLHSNGMDRAITELAQKGIVVFGICGGYQLMGNEISDDVNAEGGGIIKGLSLLPVKTVFSNNKKTVQVKGITNSFSGDYNYLSNISVSGYEIHMGRTDYTANDAVYFCKTKDHTDGCVNDNCIGTYIHGIFDNDDFRKSFIDILCIKKGVIPMNNSRNSYNEFKQRQYDLLADVIRENLDMKCIYEALGINDK